MRNFSAKEAEFDERVLKIARDADEFEGYRDAHAARLEVERASGGVGDVDGVRAPRGGRGGVLRLGHRGGVVITSGAGGEPEDRGCGDKECSGALEKFQLQTFLALGKARLCKHSF